jgi:hypothetical protein
MKPLKVTAVIPAFKEQKNIRRILIGCQKHADSVREVISKKSTDRTKEIVEKNGIPHIIDNGIGKGEAIGLAFEKGKAILVFTDSDGSMIHGTFSNRQI